MDKRSGNLEKAREVLDDYENGRDWALKVVSMNWLVRFAAQIVRDHELAEEIESLKLANRHPYIDVKTDPNFPVFDRLLAKGFVDLVSSDEIKKSFTITAKGKKELLK